MSWLTPTSTAGRWRTILQDNFTGFTGFFPESDLKQAYDAKLVDIRTTVMASNLVTTMTPRVVVSAGIDDALTNAANALRANSNQTSTNRADSIENDRDTQSLQYLITTYGDISGIQVAYRNEYLID